VEPVKPIASIPPIVPVEKPIEKAEVKVVEQKPVVERVEAKVDDKAKDVVKANEKPAVVKGGKWGVQLAAVNTIADGNAMASKAVKDFAPLKVLTPKVSPVPGGGKYRVQFVGLKDREAAAEVCAKLKGKQGCFPVSVQ
jgi:cell division septation protein DedD